MDNAIIDSMGVTTRNSEPLTAKFGAHRNKGVKINGCWKGVTYRNNIQETIL